jgi:mitochondrial fission protein ELM1
MVRFGTSIELCCNAASTAVPIALLFPPSFFFQPYLPSHQILYPLYNNEEKIRHSVFLAHV